MKCMCAQTRPWFILSSERVSGGMEFEPTLTPREKSPLPQNFPRGGSNPRRCGQRAQTLSASYSGPHTLIPKSLGGMESEPIFTLRKKSPLPEAQRRFEPATLHLAGQPAQHTANWAILALSRTSHVSDLKTGTVEATLPGSWR